MEEGRRDQVLKQERRKHKADWLISNIRSYLDLASDAKAIEELFELGDDGIYYLKPEKSMDDLLFGIIKFFRSYKNYDKSTAIYYFDNYLVENFLSRLQAEWLGMHDKKLPNRL